jgi:hypothetical protein
MSDENFERVSSRWSSSSIRAGVMVELIFACVLFLIAALTLFNEPSVDSAVKALVVGSVGSVLVSRVVFRLKYRKSLCDGIEIGRDGITGKGGEGTDFMPWDRFSRAEHLPLVPVFRLWSNDSSRPVVIFEMGGWGPSKAAAGRRELATRFITEGLKTRLKKRWLLW